MSSGALSKLQYLYLDNNQIGDEVRMPASRAHALSPAASQPQPLRGWEGGRGTGQGAAQGVGQWSGLQLSRLQTRCRFSAGFVQTARVAPWGDAPPRASCPS